MQEAGVDVIEIDRVTKFPECFEGRVKTLNPYIHVVFYIKGIIATTKRGTRVKYSSDRFGMCKSIPL